MLISLAEEKKYTTQQMADRIGVTRSAVCGKLYRLKNEGFVPKSVPTERMNRSVPLVKKKSIKLKTVGLMPVDPKDSPKPIGPKRDFAGHGTCKYIYGNPGSGSDWQTCGHKAEPAMVYCEYHVHLTRGPKNPYVPKEFQRRIA